MDNMRLRYAVSAVIVLTVIAVMLHRREAATPQETLSPTPTPEASVSVSVSPTATPKKTPRPRRTPTPTPSPTPIPTPIPPTYDEVVTQYTGHRIEFDKYCQATPVENSFPDGTQVMFDNRSSDVRIIALNGIQHSLAAENWEVIALTDPVLPATWAVDCGTAQNVAKIVIEPLTPSVEPSGSPTASSSAELTPTPSIVPQ